MIDQTRGVLYPERLPEFHRLPPPAAAGGAVAWFWVPEWDLPEGVRSRQHVVAYPACNLVIDAQGITVSGATTRATSRVLTGRGWAVGAMLRPSAVPALLAALGIDSAADILDEVRPVDDPAWHAAVCAVMEDAGVGYRERAVERFASELAERVVAPRVGDALADEMFEVLMGARAAASVEEAAARLAVSVRTLQRLTHRTVGLPPAAMIRRRRLQEAAQRVRDCPDADLASIASSLGYADHAHLTRDFRTVLGMAPRDYRGGEAISAG